MAITDPTDIAGLAAWYDAAAPSALTTSTTFVTGWADESGNGRNLSIVGTGNAPSLGGTLNGHTVVDANGVNKYLGVNLGANYTGTALTWFCLTRRESTAQAWGRVAAFVQAEAFSDWQFDGSFGVARDGGDGSFPITTRNGTSMDPGSDLGASSAWIRIIITFDGTTSRLYVDGTQVASTSETRAFNIGRYMVGYNFEGGDHSWAEHGWYTAALDSTEVGDLDDYLDAKWFGSSAVTGTAAVTTANDTSTASGSSVVGSSATTNANSTSTASGTHSIAGTSATTNAGDTSTASGTAFVAITGTSATTNADDTSAASGTAAPPGVSGTAAVTEGADTSTATGIHSITGSAAVTAAGDTSTASGTAYVAITGAAAVTTADDTSTASGTHTPPGAAGSAAITEGADTSSASGTHVAPVTGTSATTNADDTSTAAGAHGVAGTSATTGADDTSTASGTHVGPVTGTSATTNADDTSAASGTVLQNVTGTATVVAGNDTSTATGTFVPLVFVGRASSTVSPRRDLALASSIAPRSTASSTVGP